jgi:hypothetical protein
MSHMQTQIEEAEFIKVETDNGTEYFPADLLTAAELDTVRAHSGDAGERTLSIVRPYVEASQIHEVTTRQGWGYRLSAPGYLDCTAWQVFDTEEEARAAAEDEAEDTTAPAGWDSVDTSTEEAEDTGEDIGERFDGLA